MSLGQEVNQWGEHRRLCVKVTLFSWSLFWQFVLQQNHVVQ